MASAAAPTTTPATELEAGRLGTTNIPAPVTTDYLTLISGFQLEVKDNVIPPPIPPVVPTNPPSESVKISTDGWINRLGAKVDSFNPIYFPKTAGQTVTLVINIEKVTADAVIVALQPSENTYCSFSGPITPYPVGPASLTYTITITSKGVSSGYVEFRSDLSFTVNGAAKSAAVYGALQRT